MAEKATENDPVDKSSESEQITSDKFSSDQIIIERPLLIPKLCGYDFWRKTLKSPKFVLAPMVDASELAWRMLSRGYGAQLCYTPMFHANVFVKDARYRRESLQTCPEDRPLIVQFCANDPSTLVKAAQLAAPFCDGIDLNLGCPQAIAKRGNYGAFLQDKWDLIHKMIRYCHEYVSVPITAKIRIFPDVEKTVKYAKMLESAGVQILTVHGRTRDQKGIKTGLAEWNVIKTVKDALEIPIFANGNIQCLEDAERCMEVTAVDGVMTAEGNLHNPAILHGISPPIWKMAQEYLELVKKYPCPLSYARGHLFKLFQHFLPLHTDIRDDLSHAHDFDTLDLVTDMVKERSLKAEVDPNIKPYENGLVKNLKLPFWLCQPYERPPPCEDPQANTKLTVKRPIDDEEVFQEGKKLSKNQLKKLRRNPKKIFRAQVADYTLCSSCQNPACKNCQYLLCRQCCKVKSYKESLDCAPHGLKFKTKRQNKDKVNLDDTGNS